MCTSHAALINEGVALSAVVCSVDRDTLKSLLFPAVTWPLGLWGKAECLDHQLCFPCWEKRFSCAGCLLLLLRAPTVQQRPGRCAFKQHSFQMDYSINCSPVHKLDWPGQFTVICPRAAMGCGGAPESLWWQPSLADHAGLTLAQCCSQVISLAPCCGLKPSLSHTEVCGEVVTLQHFSSLFWMLFFFLL